MEVKIKENEIRKLVFKTLCHVLVEKRLYHKFRCCIGHKNSCTTLYLLLNNSYEFLSLAQRMGKRDNPFLNTTTREDVYELMGNIGQPIKPQKISNTAIIQNRIITLLNSLLHSCVEYAVKNIMEVEEIGRETFNLVCEQIFGKDFVDETEKDVPENVKMVRKLQEEYAKENGNADNFMEWISRHHRNIFDNNELILNTTTRDNDIVDWDDEFVLELFDDE